MAAAKKKAAKVVQTPDYTGPDRRADRGRNALLYYALIALTVLLVLTIIGSFQIKEQSNQDAEDGKVQDYKTRLIQQDNCVKNGNAFRAQVRAEFVSLKRDVLIPVFSEVASTIPPQVSAHQILTDAVANMHHRIKTINERLPNVDCLKDYPSLDDPRTDADESEGTDRRAEEGKFQHPRESSGDASKFQPGE